MKNTGKEMFASANYHGIARLLAWLLLSSDIGKVHMELLFCSERAIFEILHLSFFHMIRFCSL
jgi:hypothetical protein